VSFDNKLNFCRGDFVFFLALVGKGNNAKTSGELGNEKASKSCTSPPPLKVISSDKEQAQTGYYLSIDFLHFDLNCSNHRLFPVIWFLCAESKNGAKRFPGKSSLSEDSDSSDSDGLERPRSPLKRMKSRVGVTDETAEDESDEDSQSSQVDCSQAS
jgi:hypothetical protein